MIWLMDYKIDRRQQEKEAAILVEIVCTSGLHSGVLDQRMELGR